MKFDKLNKNKSYLSYKNFYFLQISVIINHNQKKLLIIGFIELKKLTFEIKYKHTNINNLHNL